MTFEFVMTMEDKEATAPIPEPWRSYEEKHIASSFETIAGMEGRMAYTIRSQSASLDGVAIRLWKSERRYDFETDTIKPSAEFYDRNNMYGFASAVHLSGGDYPLVLDRTKSISHQISAHVLHGSSHELSFDFDETTLLFQRLVLPIGADHEEDFRSYIDSKGVRIGSTYRGAGIIEVELKASRLQLFVSEREKERFLFVDSSERMILEAFLKCCSATLLALGFLTGYYPRDEQYVLQSISNDRREISGARFRRLSDTIGSSTRVLSHNWHTENNGQKRTGKLDPSMLSKLVQRCMEDDRLARALRLVVTSNPLTIEVKAAVYCVALETVKNIIMEGAGDRVKPIQDKKVVEEVLLQFRQIVAALPAEAFGDQEGLMRKIDNINSPPNRRSFSKCFELLGIELTSRDEECLSSRDEFLHGKIPFDGSEDPDVDGDLPFMIAKLHFLVSALVMKFIGYSGPLLNNAATFNWKLKDKTHSEDPVRYI